MFTTEPNVKQNLNNTNTNPNNPEDNTNQTNQNPTTNPITINNPNSSSFFKNTLNTTMTNNTPNTSWTENQYNQLKNQMLCYKMLLRNQSIPSDLITNITNYENQYLSKSKQDKIEKNKEIYEKRFENQDLTMKELANYFKKRMKEQDSTSFHTNIVTNINKERNFSEDVEYTVDHEIENKKQKLTLMSKSINNNNNMNEEDRLHAENESKFYKLFNLQMKVRKEVLTNFISELEKQNSIYYTDMLFQKTLLDRKLYKRQVNNTERNKRDQRVNERFEQQLRNGYDIRKKNKHRDFLNEVVSYHKDFSENFKNKKLTMKKRAIQAKNFLDLRERKDIQAKEKLERERIKFLKDNDIDKYMGLLREAKNTRLLDFMGQTDAFLKEIENKVLKQKETVIGNKNLNNNDSGNNNIEEDLIEEHTEKNDIKMTEMNNAEEENPDSFKPNNKENTNNQDQEADFVPNYYSTAHSIKEEIIQQPTILSGGTLKSYQLTGIQWMISLYNNKLNGILADEMGLGKTIQTIALLSYCIEKKKNKGPFLIVVPLSTVPNWTLEFAKWAPTIKVIVYKGAPAIRKAYAYQIKNEQNSFNVVVTTYEYIMKDKYALNKIPWEYIIVDEGHRMKNSKSKFTLTLGTQFISKYRILLTGTPLQNNLAELWALLNFLLPKIFNSCENFEKWFNQPFSGRVGAKSNTEKENIDITEEEQLLIINRLHRVLRPFLLRREKKQVEKELPNKVEHVIKIELSAWQSIVYEQIRKYGLLARDPSTGKIGNKSLNNIMIQLKKICNHPYLFLDRENIINTRINDDIFRCSGKFELLDRIIPKLLSCNHKILIFSQMTQLMDILQIFLDYRGISHLRLDGSTKVDDRELQMKEFSNPNSPYKVFILSTRAGGLGLNLQTADTVIIFDSDWNPQMDIQAQDRAHRIGQRNEVKVLRLITQTEIEEEILSKAAFKKNLDDKIIKAGLYNTSTSDQERKKHLEDLLKNEREESEYEEEICDDEQINTIISRKDSEFVLFQQMDQERYKYENKEKVMGKKHFKDIIESGKHVNYRLMIHEEVPVWVSEIKEMTQEEEMLEYGKGMRIKPKVDYKDEINEDAMKEIYMSDNSSEFLEKKRRREKKSGVNNISNRNSNTNMKRVTEKIDSMIYEENNSNNNNFNSGSNKYNNINKSDTKSRYSRMSRSTTSNNNRKIKLNIITDEEGQSEEVEEAEIDLKDDSM